MQTLPTVRKFVPLLTAIMAGSVVFAQTPPPKIQTTSSDVAKDQPVQLEAFRVDTSKDVGYRATNAITGTQLNTPMKDIPFAIDVFNREFIVDIGATSFRDVLQYDTGVQLFNTLSGGVTQREDGLNRIENEDSEVQVRGYRVPSLRNGFFNEVRIDTINLSRVERAGGPTSLLYGIGAMSGIPNNITMIPNFRNQASATATVGSFEFKRVGFGVERGFDLKNGRKFGAAVFGSYEEKARLREGAEIAGTKNTYYLVNPVFRMRPFAQTDVVAEVGLSKRKSEGNGPTDIGAGYVPFLPTGQTALLGRDLLKLGRSINLGGSDPFTDERDQFARVEIIQKIGSSLTLLVAGQSNDFLAEGLEVGGLSLSTFAAAPAAAKDADGRSLSWHWRPRTVTTRLVNQARVTALIERDFLPNNRFLGGTQKLVLGNQYTLRENADLNQNGSTAGRTVFFQAANNLSPFKYDGSSVGIVANELYRQRWLNGQYAIYQGSFWGDRIIPIAGIRHERYQTRRIQYNYTNGVRGAVYADPLVGRRATLGDGFSNRGKAKESTDPTYGLSFRVTKDVNVYGVISTGIDLPNEAQSNGYGQQFDARELSNKEVGLKLDLNDGKISARVALFRGEQINNVRNLFYAPGTGRNIAFDPNSPVVYDLTAAGDRPRFFADPTDRAYLQSQFRIGADAIRSGQPLPPIPNAILFSSRTRTPINNNPNMDRGAYVNTDDQTEGAEVRVDFNPNRSISAFASYTYNDVTILKGASGIVDPTALTGLDTIFAYLSPENFSDPLRPSTYNGIAQKGQKLNDTPKHTFSVFGRYSFLDGALKGSNLRLAARYAGERVTQGIDAQFDRIGGVAGGLTVPQRPLLPSSLFFDFGAGYTRKFGNYPVRFDLNVRNLLGDEKLEATNAVGVTRLYVDPRDIQFSISTSF